MTLASHKKSVGFFVLTGIAILMFGIACLGGGNFMQKKATFTMYFDSSVAGLSEGAPVVFRGVPLGSVTNISLLATDDMTNVIIPVTVTIDPASLVLATGIKATNHEAGIESIILDMIAHGMKAQLEVSSLITGQIRIMLDYYPNVEPRYFSDDHDHEIPTMLGTLESLEKSLSKLPIDEIAQKIIVSLDTVSNFVSSGTVPQTLKNIRDLAADLDTFVKDLHNIPGLTETILQSASVSAKAVEKELPPTLVSLRTDLDALHKTLDNFSALSKGLNANLGASAPVYTELQRTLKEITAAVRSLRALTDTLERNPESLLKGRKGAY